MELKKNLKKSLTKLRGCTTLTYLPKRLKKIFYRLKFGSLPIILTKKEIINLCRRVVLRVVFRICGNDNSTTVISIGSIFIPYIINTFCLVNV